MRPHLLSIALVFALSTPAFAQALDVSQRTEAPPGALSVVVDGGRNRTCPPGSVMAGIRHDQEELLCLRIDTERFVLGDAALDAPSDGGRGIPINNWPGNASANQRTANYGGPSLHWCGPGRVMSAYNVEINTFACHTLTARSGQPAPGPLVAMRIDATTQAAGAGHHFTHHAYTDRNNRRITMHACPPGWAMMGLHFDSNIFLCGLVYPPGPAAPLSQIDYADTTRAWMQVGAVTSGFTGARPLETFTDELRQLHSVGSQCRVGDIMLRDRFQRWLRVARDTRGAVAVSGSGAFSVSWRCGTGFRSVQCAAGTNVLDVGQWQGGALVLRCLRRSPPPWTP